MKEASVAIPVKALDGRAVVSPALDFLLLGGASLILFPVVMYAFPAKLLEGLNLFPVFLAVVVALNYVINFPHFAYSYQLMYRDFFKKITGQIDPALRYRYLFSGVAVPVLLVAFFIYGTRLNSTLWIKQAINVMLLTAGWHYAKQGFGILIVASIYQKVFYSLWERRFLLVNAHLLWVFAWILFNTGSQHKVYFGIAFYTLGLPSWIATSLGVLIGCSTLALVVLFWRKWRQNPRAIPVNGVTAYVASAYLWIILRFGLGYDNMIHPIVLLIPAMHSIQYITIVMRMKRNQVERNHLSKGAFIVFVLGGVAIGALIFDLLPAFLDKSVFYDKAIYGPTLFMFMFWIFINVHHYFIDNVIWRREGAEPKTFLFPAR